MTAGLAPELMNTDPHALAAGARSCLAGCAPRTYAEQSGFDPGRGGFDGLALRQAELFAEHSPRDVVRHHEREGNGLADRKPEGAACRSQDLLQTIPAPCPHVSHLSADAGFVEFEQRGERRALLLIHAGQHGDELPEELGRLPGLGDIEPERVPERLQQLRLDRAQEVLAGGEVVVDRAAGGVRPLGDHVHRQSAGAHLPEHLNRCLDKTPPA
jgi:hypothetical protein